MKFLAFSICLLLHLTSFGQHILFKQKNKILEYNYGVTDSVGMNNMSELEKIKYELNFVEKTYEKTIFNNYTIKTEIAIDSNDYDQNWMNLPSKYIFTIDGLAIYDKQGNLLRTVSLTLDQSTALQEEKSSIIQLGYHPGLPSFPTFQANLQPMFQQEGYAYELLNNGDLKISKGTHSTTYSIKGLNITEEYIDEDGKKNKITKGYEKMEFDKGYLLSIEKQERFLNLEKGPCLTEIRLRYFHQYKFEDTGKLIERTLANEDQVNLFPNPNSGQFTVAVKLKPGVRIQSAKIINLINGQSLTIETNNQSVFEVNRTELSKGNYNFQIITSENKIINTNFIKN